MHDILLDWEDQVLEYDLCLHHAQKADLVICLGTSLRIEPVGSLPLDATNFVIVNLQPTPYDENATLVLRAKVDTVMDHVTSVLYGPDWFSKIQGRSPSVERLWIPTNMDSIKEFQQIVKDKGKRSPKKAKHKR
jgi:hypothetical protein